MSDSELERRLQSFPDTLPGRNVWMPDLRRMAVFNLELALDLARLLPVWYAEWMRDRPERRSLFQSEEHT